MIRKILFSLHRFKKGKTVCIFIIHKCNIVCSYCSAKMINKRFPNIDKCLTPREWMDILAEDKNIKIVEISGGEPLMYPYLAQFLKLLTKKYYVRIYSNLMLRVQLPRSHKIRFRATYHYEHSKTIFMAGLRYYRRKFLINVDEFKQQTIKGSYVRPFTLRPEDKVCKAEYCYASNGKKYSHYNEIEKDN